MTLLNVHLTHVQALVATDSLAYSSKDAGFIYLANGEPMHTPKLWQLGACVLTGRGRSALFDYLYSELRPIDGIDAMIELMPAILSQALAQVPSIASGHRDLYPRDEVWLIGWSPKHAQMVGVTWGSDNGFQGAVDPGRLVAAPQPVDGGERACGIYAPSPARSCSIWMKRPQASMLEFAREQIEQSRAEDRVSPYGGRLILAVLGEHSVTIEDAGDLGLPAPSATEETRACLADLIGAEAATVALVATATAITASGTSQTTSGPSLSYFNNTTATVAMQVDASFGDAYCSALPLATTALVLMDQSGAVGGSTSELLSDIKAAAAPAASNYPGFARAFQYSLAAGATLTCTVKVRIAGSSAGCAITADAVVLRVTAIKR